MIESLGIGDPFYKIIDHYQSEANIKLVKISTELNKCFKRVLSRDKSEHTSVSDEQVKEYNLLAATVQLNWDLIIDNNDLATTDEIVSSIKTIL